jgi:hypothetical protein
MNLHRSDQAGVVGWLARHFCGTKQGGGSAIGALQLPAESACERGHSQF